MAEGHFTQTERAYTSVRAAILGHLPGFAPGSVIAGRPSAEQFDVSLTVMQRVFDRLENVGLLVCETKFYRVPVLEAKATCEIFVALCQAAWDAVCVLQHAPATRLSELVLTNETLLSRIDNDAQSESVRQFLETERAFHMGLSLLAEHRLGAEHVGRLFDLLHLACLPPLDGKYMQRHCHEHATILRVMTPNRVSEGGVLDGRTALKAHFKGLAEWWGLWPHIRMHRMFA